MIVVAGIMSDFEGIGDCMLRLQEAAASKGRGGEITFAATLVWYAF
eukprot:COSAG02_NODE_57292_length_281_cov_0.697802_1_plen_45_part_01